MFKIDLKPKMSPDGKIQIIFRMNGSNACAGEDRVVNKPID